MNIYYLANWSLPLVNMTGMQTGILYHTFTMQHHINSAVVQHKYLEFLAPWYYKTSQMGSIYWLGIHVAKFKKIWSCLNWIFLFSTDWCTNSFLQTSITIYRWCHCFTVVSFLKCVFLQTTEAGMLTLWFFI